MRIFGQRVLVVMLAGLAASLPGCSESQDLENHIRSSLKDPDSAKFGEINISQSGKFACVEVNAKNSFGGYTGFSSMILKKVSGKWNIIQRYDEINERFAQDDCLIEIEKLESSNSMVDVAEGIMPEPGQYKATITMTGMEIPGMPADMAGHGSGMTTTSEYCLTEEDVAQGFEEMMKRGQDGECAYESFNLDGGKMDAVMVCKTPAGEARMTMNGTASPTTSDFTATMKMNVPEMGEGTMSFAAKHERIGDCPAK
jgi:hypothetical protein